VIPEFLYCKKKDQKMSIKEEIISVARQFGIHKVGFTSRKRLENAPPSADLGYVLPDAKSAVSLAVALEKPAIRAYLSKEDQTAHVRDHKLSYMKLVEASKAIANLLRKKGYEAASPWPNIEYRENMPYMAMVPPVSHRYIACAAGLGWLGWSGNLIMPEYGATVSLSTVATSAALEPDPMVQGDSCRKCRLCAMACPSRFIAQKDETEITIGELSYTHNRKASNLRCVVTCGGANGVRRPDAKWSTWSYKVLDLPGPGDEEAFKQKVLDYAQDEKNRLLRAIVFDLEKRDFANSEEFKRFWEEKVMVTCANCMLICWPDLKDRKENLRLLTTSGRVVRSDTGLRVVK
jgi:epoxyqueuosine reductase